MMFMTSKHQDLERYSAFIAGLEQNLLPDDAEQHVALAGQEANISQREVTIADFWHLASCHRQLFPLQLTWAVCIYKKKEKGDQSTICFAKCSVVRGLGLWDAAVPLAQMVGWNPDIAVICCDYHVDTNCKSPYKRGRVLNAAPGKEWYTVALEQSTIFVNSEGEIELAVICGCSGGNLDVLEYGRDDPVWVEYWGLSPACLWIGRKFEG
ncbi:hypothetical protein BKA82DRAFT_4014346 [Pisolithus tinctorius]|nr:hypothetical protein BKA82DRAFT_4014346 [Pisolithus tinctorius]